MKIFERVIRNPNAAISASFQLALGHFYRMWFKLTGKRVRIGKDFRVKGLIYNIGPGRVIIGDHVRMRDGISPYTCTKEATIEIGNNCILTGTRFACASKITVGPKTRLADCRILDTNFHGEDPNERGEDKIPVSVKIGENVWIAMNAIVLKGSIIGDNSIISPNSVVAGSTVLPNKVYMGNPARAVKPL